mmetsp:Transcript_9599/g.23548  ORF Transcript_9599/g.23548 Transcript_9599/m.23548 type:complete len:538 (+) Transcript_9599:345-1958(+)|eukprot:g9949.t1
MGSLGPVSSPSDKPMDEFDVAAHTPACITKFNRVEAEHAKGCHVTDVNGRTYLDLSSGIGVLSTGHCHPKVVRAVQQQAEKMCFAQQNCIYTTKVHKELVRKLHQIMPGGGRCGGEAVDASGTADAAGSRSPSAGSSSSASSPLDTFFFCNSGAEAVENAVKVARMATGKQNIVCISGGYHGRTFGSMALTTSKNTYRRCFGPLMPGVCLLDVDWTADPFRTLGVGTTSSSSSSEEDFAVEILTKNFERLLVQQTDSRETAAVLLEPILGEGGIIQIPVAFLQYLRKRCTELNILLVFDEVQCGMGRSGKVWACEHANVVPDVLIFAKGIASGFPLAGIAFGKEKVSDKLLPNALGGTYGGQAVSVAAAAATIDVLLEEKLCENACAVGEVLGRGLRSVKKELEEVILGAGGTSEDVSKAGAILAVRQYGLFIAVELNPALLTAPEVMSAALDIASLQDESPGTGGSDCDGEEKIKSAVEQEQKIDGMIMIPGGKNGLRVAPPLLITQGEAKVFLHYFSKVMHSLVRGKLQKESNRL